MRKLAWTLAVAGLMAQSVGSFAQVVVPSAYANQPAEFQVAGAAGIHYQQIFAASEFWPAAETNTIQSVNWRLGSWLYPGTYTWSIPRIDVWLATTPQTPAGLSPVFAENYAGSTDRTLVYSGPITFTGTIIAGELNNFDIKIPLQVPFAYTPGKGNLLLDVIDYDFYANLWDRQVELAATSLVTNYVSTDYRYDTGDVGRFAAGTGGLVTQFSSTYTPPSSIVPISVSFNPASVVGGNTSTGTVTLNGPAPSGGLSVSLASDTTAVSVPSAVTIPAGSNSVAFQGSTSAVPGTIVASVTASAGGSSAIGTLTVNPAPTVIPVSLTISPASVVGGKSATGTVTLSAPAPALGYKVYLSSNTAGVTVPVSIKVAAGALSGKFTIKTTAVSVKALATIKATAGSTTLSAPLTVNPPAYTGPTMTSFTINPLTLAPGEYADGHIVLSAPAPPTGVTVKLSSSNPAVLSVPASVTINPGDNNVDFQMVAGPVSAATQVIIKATLGTQVLKVTVTVAP